jgi:membrane protein implicated in regulation of membrane protease activity
MILLYTICAVIGGGFVLLSSFFGGDAEADHDLDQDADSEIDHDADVDHDAHSEMEMHGGSVWLPFFSFKFWTFSLAFFGLTGLLLRLLTDIGTPLELVFSIPTGTIIGSGVTYALRSLRKNQISSSIGHAEFIGQDVEVLLPVSKEQAGKIRVELKERKIELLATTDEQKPLQAGEKAVIVALDEGLAKIERFSGGESIDDKAAARIKATEMEKA